MLLTMRRSSRLARFVVFAFSLLLCVFAAQARPLPGPPHGQQQAAPPPKPQATPQQPSSTPSQSPAVQPPAAPATAPYTGPMIVLDPAHGGTDTGARGETGALEKDLVLDYAGMARSELESQGFHVVLTRNGDTNVSFVDRAAMANSYRNAIFITLHVASTGAFGTVRTYYYQFGSEPAPPPAATNANAAAAPARSTTLIPWDEAQLPHVDVSRQLAAAIQAQLAQRFNGSPATPTPAAVRDLRSIDAPAVAIEVSSVSVQNPNALAALAGPLAVSIARGIQAFLAAGPSGGK